MACSSSNGDAARRARSGGCRSAVVASRSRCWRRRSSRYSESGRIEVYVRLLSGESPGPVGKVQISTGSGGWPRWRADGKEIFYDL